MNSLSCLLILDGGQLLTLQDFFYISASVNEGHKMIVVTGPELLEENKETILSICPDAVIVSRETGHEKVLESPSVEKYGDKVMLKAGDICGLPGEKKNYNRVSCAEKQMLYK